MCYMMISLPAPLAPLTRLAVRHFLVREEDRLGPLLDAAAAVHHIISQRHEGTLRPHKLPRLISDPAWSPVPAVELGRTSTSAS